jgi:hypothetical protein
VAHLNQADCRHDVAEFIIGADALKTGGQAGIMHPHAKMFVREHPVRPGLIVGGDQSAFARGDKFAGVETENGNDCRAW